MMGKGTHWFVLLGLLLCVGVSWGQMQGKKAIRSAVPSTHLAQVSRSPVTGTGPSRGNPAPAMLSKRATEVERATAQSSRPYVNDRTAAYGTFEVNGVLGNLGDSSRYVAIPDAGDLYQDYDGTFEMWVYPSLPYATSDQVLISKGDTTAQEYMIGLANHNLFFRLNEQVALNNDGDTIPGGQWTHIAVTWTGGGPYFVNFFVNGTQNGKTDTLNTVWAHNTDSLIFGTTTYKPWDIYYFSGNLDEVRLWNPALTGAQIATDRFIGLGDGYLSNASNAITWSTAYEGLLASWTFNTGGAAYDDIGGHTGSYRGGAGAFAATAGQPIPYNFALDLAGNDSSNVYVPSNTSFDRTTSGSLEMWVKPYDVHHTPLLLSKGATSDVSFAWGIEAYDSTQFFRIGSVVYNDSMKVPMKAWSHVAVTWTNGPNYVVTFYLDGRPGRTDSSLATWNINTNPVIIGGIAVPGWTYEAYNGYLDEVRFWQRQLTASEIQQHMFASGRALTGDADLIGLWNFDGNLNNLGNLTGVNGSFNNGMGNNARFSGYLYEAVPGPPSGIYGSHSTTLNWYFNGTPGIWPAQFVVAAPFATIHDNDTTRPAISDINVTTPSGTVGSVTAFLAIDHTYIGDIVARITAPNGQTRVLLQDPTDNDGNENALTFFDDGFNTDETNATYFAPWGYIRPLQPFGNFGGSPVQGTWTLKVFDAFAQDSGVVKGWGLRFYNTVAGVGDDKKTLPTKFDLAQNYPNPFNPSTTIAFSIPREINVRLAVYDILGQEVATLVDETMKPGNHAVSFDAVRLASGTYFYRLTAGSYTATRKMLLLK